MSSATGKRPWAPVVQKLHQMIQDNNWSQEFYQAIHEAKKADIPALDTINSPEDFLDDINEFLNWMPVENQRGDMVYNKICLFYWILDQPSLIMLQSQILPKEAGKPLTDLSKWIVEYANALGTFLDTPESIDDATIQTFYDSKAYHMDQYERPADDWKTFNEFFARHVKQGLREPEDPTNPEVVVSPADSVFDGSWNVNGDNDVIFVKGIPWNIQQLLDGSDYADAFKGGKFMHSFLNTTDYHRLHAPVQGTVIEAKVIPGACYLEVVPVTDPTGPLCKDGSGGRRNKFAMRRRLTKGKTDANIIRHVYQGVPMRSGGHNLDSVPFTGKEGKEGSLDAPDTPGYQFLQARGCVVLDTPIGLVAVLPIGMAQVSSVKLSVECGQTVKKGEELAYFQLGGSDIVLVFEADSQVDFTATEKVHYNVGRMIATAKVPILD
jgi:phosphatidylserine decarboxylase